MANAQYLRRWGADTRVIVQPASVAPMKSVTGWSQGLAYKNCSSREIGNWLIDAERRRTCTVSLDERSDSQFVLDSKTELRLVKPVNRVTEGAFSKCENLCRGNRKELHLEPVRVKKLSVTSYVLPATVPLRSKRLTHELEYVLIRSFASLAFDDNVDSVLPIIATGRQNNVGVRAKVCGFLFVRSGREVQCIVYPNGYEWRDVGPSISANAREPKQFS